MGKIYSTQTDLTIKVNTGKNLAGISLVFIEALSPSRTQKTFAASIVNIPGGLIQYSVTSENDFKEVGEWIIWAKIINSQGLVSIGEPSKFTVYKKGT